MNTEPVAAGCGCDCTGCRTEKEVLRHAQAALEFRLAAVTTELTYVKAALNEHAIVAFTDQRGRILAVNDKFCAISQYAREELIGQDHRIINSGHHSKVFIRHLWTTITSGQVWKGEIQNRAKDGSFYWVDTTIVPFVDAAGKPAQFVAIRNDITERKRGEEALRASADQFRTMANSIPALAWVARADGYIVWYNERWHEYTGTTPDEMEGWGWQRVHDPAVLPSVLERWTASIASGQPFEMQFPLRRADGIFRPFLTRVLPLKNDTGRVVQWFGTNTDITSLVQSEQVLLERLRLATRAASVGIWDWDLVQNTLLWDDTMYELYGVTREQFSGAYEAWERGIHPDDLVQAREDIRLAIAGEKPFDTAFRTVWSDRSVHYIHARATVLRNESGTPIRMLGTNADLTARKRAEEELISAREVAESATRAKSGFLAVMSHEIRTPMNAIIGMADLLWESRLDATQRQYVEIFRRNGHTLLALINDILDLSKIEAGRFELDAEPFSLDDVLRQALELIAPRARAKGLTLDLERQPSIPASLVGDPMRLRQVLVNLLGNAVKFTERGGIGLTVAHAGPDDACEITFAVVDSGPGIPPHQLERIFADFTQADLSTTRNFGGTGLGLGISRRLVEQMGGRLAVTSTVGQGSTFTFSARFAAAPPQRVPREVVNLEGCRVLLIDDDAINRLVLRETLAVWGAESDDFGQPERALHELAGAVAQQRPYALAIVDGLMPSMDGFEAARQIRLLAPDLPVVMLASDTARGDESRRLHAGIAGFALKPINRPELLRVITKAMGMTVGVRAPAAPATESEGAAGLSILVAEDFADNRVVIEAYLKGSPHTITFADHGRHAVDLFTAGTFDLVLMDMQMPVMDGLDATRAIRAFEVREGRVPTPILAFTANARPEDIEASRRVGCNDHLSKPIAKRALLQAIARVGEYGGAPAGTSTGAEATIDLDVPEGLREFAPAYLEARRRDVTHAAALLARGDFEELSTVAHKMAGSGGLYGFHLLTALGAALEASARAADRLGVETHLEELRTYLARLRLPGAHDARER